MRKALHVVVVVGIAGLLLAAAVGAGAQGSAVPRVPPVVGSDFRISGPNATYDDASPAVAWNGTANQYLVVWTDSRNSSTRGSDIYGRRVSAAGSPVGGDFRISGPKATSGEGSPAVAWNQTANEYLVVWPDFRNSSTSGLDIYGRRVGPDGARIGGDFRISGPNATSDDDVPAVAWNGTANQYLVVWMDKRNFSSRGDDIYGRRVSAAGSPVGGDFGISGPNATSDDGWPAVTWNGTANQYLVVWQKQPNSSTGGDSGIYGRRVPEAGSPVGDEFGISGPNATSGGWVPAVTWNGTANQYLVVWMDGRNFPTRDYDIYGRRVSAAGSPVGDDFGISGPNATSYDWAPAVTWNGTANQYLVVWQDSRNSSSRGDDIYGRRLSAAGSPVGGDFRISGGPNATCSDPIEPFAAVTWNGTANQYLVVWQDSRNSSSRGDDIYGRRVAG